MKTPNHGYNAPEEGTRDWHKPLNENFEAFDRDVEIRDELATRTEYEPKDGAKFLAIDTGQTFIGTGDRWRELPTDPADATMENLAGVRVARSAAEIQPAIDALAQRDDGDVTGGVVQLAATTYYPETTIWLKRGVTLQGVLPGSHQPNPHGARFTDATVISTRDMAEGAGDVDPAKGVNTYSHADPNGENWHPHFPVIANYRTQPFELKDREPTDEEAAHWGDSVGLKDLVIHAGEKRRWWTDASEEATYFGVYDAVLFEQATDVLLENVVTSAFFGYGGFFNGCQGIIDRGSHYQGGLRDYHGAALHTSLGYPPDPQVGTSGVWDVTVSGPSPTVLIEGGGHHRFVSGGWSQARVTAQSRVAHNDPPYLGEESAYWAGEAPITDPERGEAIVVHERGSLDVDEYGVSGDGAELTGLRARTGDGALSRVSVGNLARGIDFDGDPPLSLTDCTVHNADVGIICGSHTPRVDGLKLSNCTEGISFGGSTTQIDLIESIDFAGVETAFGAGNDEPIHIHNANFAGADAAGAAGAYLTLHEPLDRDGILG